ncbi:MAG: membrane protein insertase YidC [Desulfosarcina sp.]|nr:membrane protein insertase YidC [Desulfobacterales bacterium]
MEQTRLLLAILLTFLVFVAWEFFFSNRQTVQAPPGPAQQSAPAKPEVDSAPPKAAAPPPVETAETAVAFKPSTPQRPGRLITIDTKLFEMTISANRGEFQKLVLKDFKESVAADAALQSLIESTAAGHNMLFGFKGQTVPGWDSAVYEIQTPQDRIEVQDKAKSVVLRWTSANGIEITKTFTFQPDAYLIDLNVQVTNQGVNALKDRATLSLSRTVGEGQSRVIFTGPSGFIDEKLKEIAVKDIDDKSDTDGLITWVAIVDRYFMSALIPAEAVQGTMHLTSGGQEKVSNTLVLSEVEILPGQSRNFSYKVFYGPKNTKLLEAYGHDLAKAINFGWFTFLAKPALWIMNQIYSIIPNYGIAIILLTVMTKILLWPLGNKSYKSMNEMKRMQPLMAELREKYKGDKKKVNEEMMGLYRTYKINPMGGCLPMVVQLPVFLALYNMLYGAIELRHAPFVGWINDLSTPDRLFHFGFAIPFMDAPYGIPVLTVIMGATMFLQQKMSPPPGDPTQAKLMLFMPLIFTFIFINFPAGLVLYWLVNNVLSIAQQYYIQKKYA